MPEAPSVSKGGSHVNVAPDGQRPSSRVLVLSQRRLRDAVANCVLYDFEDLLAEIDDVDIIAPLRSPIPPGRSYKLARNLRAPKSLGRALSFRSHEFTVGQDYDLFLAVLDSYRQVASVHAVKALRQRCHRAICFIPEIWPKDLHASNAILELFDVFDHIFVGVAHPVDTLGRITGKPCSNLHPAVDALRACPYPEVSRVVDICNLGRRSAVTHQALLDHARAENLFYYYDTASGVLRVKDHRGHRRLLSEMIKRTRYFIANYAKIDQPNQTSGRQEVGYRFFEGVAGGAVLVGQPPDTEMFRQLFPWPDAVVASPFDNPAIADLIRQLDADPDRLAQIRAGNVSHALREHDWLYRYETMLDAVGLPHSARMQARRERLAALAQRFERRADAALQRTG